MYQCPNCGSQLTIITELTQCPLCKGKLEKVDVPSSENNINISLSFDMYKCDCGNDMNYSESYCNVCHAKREDFKNAIDPHVQQRRESFSRITEVIEENEKRIESINKNQSLQDKVLKTNEEFIHYINISLEKITYWIDKELFKNVTFDTSTLNTSETTLKIIEIASFFTDFYYIMEEFNKIDVSTYWKNAFIRYKKSINEYVEANKLIVKTITAETFKESAEYITIAQKKLNSAALEINVFRDIICARNLETNFEIFKSGKINYSVMFVVMFLGNESINDISTSVKNIQIKTYDYFNEAFTNPIDYYLSQESTPLIRIAPFALVGMLYFSEDRFFQKIKFVLDLLNAGNNNDHTLLENGMNQFSTKYISCLIKTNYVLSELAIIFSSNVDENIIIRSALRWYKDLSEGVFRDISSILILSDKITKRNSYNLNDIFEWTNFSSTINYLQEVLKLPELTDGVEKIIRNSEAHVNFVINKDEKTVTLINKNERNKRIDELTLGFEEFFEKCTALLETVNAIIVGINIFISNNYKEFNEFTRKTDINLLDESPIDKSHFIFPLIGIIDISIETTNLPTKSILIRGTSVEKTDREIFSNSLSLIYSSITNEENLDKIRLELKDIDGKEIGFIELRNKYLQSFYTTEEKFKLYDYLLLASTTIINYCYNVPLGSSKNEFLRNDFYTGILLLTIKDMDKMVEASLAQENECLLIQDFIATFKHIICAIDEFLLINDNRNLKQVKNMIFNMTESLEKCFNNSSEAHSILNPNTKFLELHSKLVELYQKSNKHKVGRNDPCPCGSGKKYKKCCLN